jgi:hypothetical protein
MGSKAWREPDFGLDLNLQKDMADLRHLTILNVLQELRGLTIDSVYRRLFYIWPFVLNFFR